MADLHNDTGRAHCDLKPDNIGYTKNRVVKISDFGTSTVYAAIGSRKRYDMGDSAVRAPEVYLSGTHPELAADVWSYGAIMFRMLTGEYPLADKDEAYFKETSFMEMEKDVGMELKKIKQRDLRALLQDCLRPNSYLRINNGMQLKERVDEVLEARKFGNKAVRALQATAKVLAYAGAIGVAVGGLLYGMTRPRVPVDFKLPVVDARVVYDVDAYATIRMKGSTLFWYETPEPTEVTFTVEELDLPYFHVRKDFNDHTLHLTSNYHVAVLMSAYDNALLKYKGHVNPTHSVDYFVNERQYRMYRQTDGIHKAWGSHKLAAILETHMNILQINGVVDLEDLLTASVVGMTQMYQAKEAADSKDFKDYINAKRSDDFVIDRNDAYFINVWIGYAQQHTVPLSDFHPLGQDAPGLQAL